MPITSRAPRLAEMKASPVIQAGIARPDRKKSVLGLHEPLQRQSDAQHEHRVDNHDCIIDDAKVHRPISDVQRWFRRGASGRGPNSVYYRDSQSAHKSGRRNFRWRQDIPPRRDRPVELSSRA